MGRSVNVARPGRDRRARPRQPGVQGGPVPVLRAPARRGARLARDPARPADGVAGDPLRGRGGGAEGRHVRQGQAERHGPGAAGEDAVGAGLPQAARTQHARPGRPGPHAAARPRVQGVHPPARRAAAGADRGALRRTARRHGTQRERRGGTDLVARLRAAPAGHRHRRAAGRAGGGPAQVPPVVEQAGLGLLGPRHAACRPRRAVVRALPPQARPSGGAPTPGTT